MILWSRSRPLWLLALAAAVILAATPAQYFGRQEDDVLFVIASHALSYGRYARFTSPGAPPLVDVWPGLPALLLPVTWAAGDRPWAYELFMALILAACPVFLWLWLRRRGVRPAVAILIPLLFATSPLVLEQAGSVMSEAPYTLLAAAMLWLLENAAPRSDIVGWLLMAAIQIRSAGLSLLAAVAAGPLLRRSWRELALRLGPAAAACAAWFAWCYWKTGFVQEGTEWAASYAGRAASWTAVPGSNIRFFVSSLGGCFLPGALAAGPLAYAMGGVLCALCALQTVRLLRRRLDEPAAWMLVGAGGMHLFWGWQYERYWIPLLPLVLWTAAEALESWAPVALGALLAAQVAFHTQRWVRSTPWAEPEMKATYAWLRAHSEPGDVFASVLFARDGYYAARPALPLADMPDSASLERLFKRWKVRYAVWQDVDLGFTVDATASDRRALERAARDLRDPRLFRPVFRDAAGSAVVYEVL